MTGESLVKSSCPYCGETIELIVDCSLGAQQYVEDCSVCCRPIEVYVAECSNDQPDVQLKTENE